MGYSEGRLESLKISGGSYSEHDLLKGVCHVAND